MKFFHVFLMTSDLTTFLLKLFASIAKQSHLIFLLSAALILIVISLLFKIHSELASLVICHSHLAFYIVCAASDRIIVLNLLSPVPSSLCIQGCLPVWILYMWDFSSLVLSIWSPRQASALRLCIWWACGLETLPFCTWGVQSLGYYPSTSLSCMCCAYFFTGNSWFPSTGSCFLKTSRSLGLVVRLLISLLWPSMYYPDLLLCLFFLESCGLLRACVIFVSFMSDISYLSEMQRSM